MLGKDRLSILMAMSGIILLLTASGSAQAQNTYPWSATGNVGIGTTNPTGAPLVIVDSLGTTKLDGSGMTIDRGLAYVATAVSGQVFNIQTDNFRLVNQANDTTWLNVINGKVGIGTTTPNSSLTSTGNIEVLTGAGFLNNLYYSGGFKYSGNGAAAVNYISGASQNEIFSVFPINTNGAGSAAIENQAMVINSSNGYVGIGTTSPSAKLEVNGTLRFSGDTAGTVQTTAWTGVLCGGDYAESVDVSGDRKHYEPGDVLAIDDVTPGNFVKVAEPYSTAVAGIYSTKPGVLGRRQPTEKNASEIPMAMIGIVPVKVSAENGPIKPKDLLVSSSTPGYAMKGTDRTLLTGAVIGKAMGSLNSGTGVVEVLVTLQ